MEIKDIFGAYPKSTWQVLCESNVGYYIPAYQREYSWGAANIERLFEDACHGMKHLLINEDAITFIGTLITIHDQKCQTVAPHVKGETPSTVMLVIDGQQRLTTLLLINTLLHDEIRIRSSKFKKNDTFANTWLYQESVKILDKLGKTYIDDMSYGDDFFRWYPRMIRSYQDTWSRSASSAQYTSSIASYLHAYFKHVQSGSNKAFKYIIEELEDVDQSKHETIINNCKVIRKHLKMISNDESSELENPTLKQIVESKKKSFQEVLLHMEFPDEVSEKITSGNNEQDYIKYTELLRLILFGQFLLGRMAVTVVTAKNEDYAFDMFEALNTTGVPLTAFETFKPKVIQAEGLSDYINSDSKNWMQKIEVYLDSYDKAEAKQTATSNILIPFALAESGVKLSKHLSPQRRFLKDHYEKFDSIDDKRTFVKHLTYTTLFINNVWDDKSIAPKLPEAETALTDEVLICLDLLRQSNHNITIAPIVRFYSQVWQSSSSDRDKVIYHLTEAIKAITAFSVLWRASRRTTENIDSHYRTIMKSGLKAIGIEPLSRHIIDDKSGNIMKGKVPDEKKLKLALREILKDENKGGISCKEEWIKASHLIPIYGMSSHFTRFLLFAATHDTCIDENQEGLVKKAKKGVLPMMTWAQWQEANLTIEHIAPQNIQADGWDLSLYEDKELVDSIGNLSLLPLAENSSVGDRSWKAKRLIYKVLSAASVEEHAALKEEAKKEGLSISDSTWNILSKSGYLPHVDSIGRMEQDWNASFVKKRSERLLDLAWQQLAPWLGITD